MEAGDGMGWTRTATQVVHQGSFLEVHRDQVRRPDGTDGAYEHVTVADGVRVVALDSEGRVMLVEDSFYLQWRRMLHLPGGGTEGHDPHRAALRELEEETGLVAGRLDVLGVIDPLPGITAARTHLFLATKLRQGVMHRDGAEVGMTARWCALHEAVEAVRSGRITEAGSVAALLLAALTVGGARALPS